MWQTQGGKEAGAARPTALLVALLTAVCIGVSAVPTNAAVTYNPTVATMIGGVTQAQLEPTVRDLSGEQQTLVGGLPVTITSRSSSSGVPIDLAEQYVYEHMASYGLNSVSYQSYPGQGGSVAPGRNIIGQITGTTNPGQIVVISAHLDNMPRVTPNYGADDNASGVASLLYMARTFAGHSFAYTIQFVAFGSEENGPGTSNKWGSGYYVSQGVANGQNFIADINLDAIGVTSDGTNAWIQTRMASKRPAAEANMVTLWQDVKTAYGVTGFKANENANSITGSDQNAFWKRVPNIGAVWFVEADCFKTTNPNWHTLNDRVSAFNWPYYIAFTKSIVGMAAHQAGIIS
jgi:hypothetical protein